MPVVEVNNIHIHYEQIGEGNVIVLLHGYTGSSQDWINQTAVLSDKYRVIAVDHRGHGKSEAPKSEEDYSIPIFADDVYKLLIKLRVNRCILVGHSMGGFMSLQFVLDHPEMVQALVLVDTSSGEFEMAPGAAELRVKLDELARNEGLEAAFEYDSANNPMRIERYEKHPELKEISRQKVLNTSVDGYIYVARTFGKWQPVTKKLHEIKVPTLIFWGEEDTPFLRASQILRDSIHGAELVTIPGVGHSPHEEAPDLFNETLVAFLQKN